MYFFRNSLENTPQSFNQLQNIAPIQKSENAVFPKSLDCFVPLERPENTIPFQNESQRMMDANIPMSWKMREPELVSFDHYGDLNKRMVPYQTNEPDLAFQQPRPAMHDVMSGNRNYFRERNDKAVPIVGRLKANKYQRPVKSFSKFSLDDASDYDDTELDPSINAKAIGLYPPRMKDWDLIVAKMQLCLQYLTHLRNQRELGIEKPSYSLEISNPYAKLSHHWHCLDKIIHTEYKRVIIIEYFYRYFTDCLFLIYISVVSVHS